MIRNRENMGAMLMALGLLMSGALFGASGDKAQVQGMIIDRTGETLIVSNSQGRTTVVPTGDTKTKDDRGLFGLEKEQMADVVLIPGLKVSVEGTPEANGSVTAKTITVDGDDLESSQMIQAGLHPTAEQVEGNVQKLAVHAGRIESNKQDVAANKQGIAANKQDIVANTQQIQANMKDIQENTERFSALADYDVKGQATVKFAVGSSKIAPVDLEQLKTLAQTATGLKGYIIEVTGYADATGAAMMNEKLSEDRAKAVVRYLMYKNPVDVTTKEILFFIVPSNVALKVQFEATAYVPETDSVIITPSWDAVVTEVNVAVVESNVIWLSLR